MQLSGLRGRWRPWASARLPAVLPSCCPEFAAVIVGVNRRGELEEVAAALTQIADRMDEFGPVPAIDPIYLDPSRWPSFTQ